jgi:hypothetical protein
LGFLDNELAKFVTFEENPFDLSFFFCAFIVFSGSTTNGIWMILFFMRVKAGSLTLGGCQVRFFFM